MLAVRRCASLESFLFFTTLTVIQAVLLSRTLERDPNHPGAHWVLELAYVQKSMYEEALAHGQKAVTYARESPLSPANLGHAHARAGNREEALKIARQFDEESRPIRKFGHEITTCKIGT